LRTCDIIVRSKSNIARCLAALDSDGINKPASALHVDYDLWRGVLRLHREAPDVLPVIAELEYLDQDATERIVRWIGQGRIRLND
jgi:hypothetical protein